MRRLHAEAHIEGCHPRLSGVLAALHHLVQSVPSGGDGRPAAFSQMEPGHCCRVAGFCRFGREHPHRAVAATRSGSEE